MGKNILVTGGTGFTGSCLVDRLLKRGHKVIALDVTKGYADEIKKNGAKVVFGSVCNKKLVNKLMKNIDVVFHVAAVFNQISASNKDYWDVNVNGTKVVLEAALKHNVKKFINCSTCGVHGAVKQIPANENAPLTPDDYYQYTKLQGELLATEFFKKNNMAGVTIRPGGIYGPRDPRFLRLFKTIKNGKFIMFGNGNVYYHLCYIDNLVDAFELAMSKKEAIGNTYLIADEKYVAIKDFVAEIAKVLNAPAPRRRIPVWPVWFAGLLCEIACKPFGIEPPLFRRRVAFFVNNRAFDISKAKRELGYKPRVSFSEGVTRTAEWYQENNFL